MALEKSKLQLLRGTELQVSAYTPLAGEPVFAMDTAEGVTTVSLHIGDGTTLGGHKFASLATVTSMINNAVGATATDAVQGTVILSDATDGTEDAATGGKAATPAAVKAVKDALDALSDTVDTFLTGADDSNGTLDRLSELVAAINANKGSIDALLSDKVAKSDISDAVDSSSSDTVASSKAVKTAYDAAVRQATNAVFGQVELSDAVNDSANDQTAHIAATPKAVAITYTAATAQATNSAQGQVLLSDATDGTETAAAGHTAATPAAVKEVADFAANMDFGTLA